jgi:hypothetical protein
MVKKAPIKTTKIVAKKPVKTLKATKPKTVVAKKAPSKPVITPEVPEVPPRPKLDDRLLTLSFLRDGDEFCVRLELANGQITEFKNRSPDQLLTMVAGELEDLLG